MELLKGFGRDLMHATRSLATARSFTVVCVVSLGIGMAPVIAVPYGARAVRIPPPLVKTDGLVELVTSQQGPHEPIHVWSYPDLLDLRSAATGMTLIGWAAGATNTTVQTPAGVETAPVATLFVSANYFEAAGVTLARGTGLSAGATEPVVVLGYNFWKNRQAADPTIVGKTMTLDGVPHVVAGIAPERFQGLLSFWDADLFRPLEEHPQLQAGGKGRIDRGERWMRIHGRLSPGVSVAQANAAVAAVTAQLARQYPATNEFIAGAVEPYFPIGALEGRGMTLIETAGLTLTGLILLVVCLNISGMMLVRSALRERELSIRQAIGASRWRLIRYLLAESIVLAGLGATLASIVLFSIPLVIAWMIDAPLPYQFEQAMRVDGAIIGICVAVCLAASVAFGLLPALRFSRPVILSALKDDVGGGGRRVGRVHRVTAALQVAIAVPLLVMGGMSLDRVRATATSDLGFQSDLLYTAPMKLDAATDSPSQIRGAAESLANADGVAAVTVADGLPLDFRGRTQPVALKTGPNEAPRFMPAQVTRVGAGYLDTMGIQLLRGRDFTADDGPGSPLVTVISKPLADELFPNADAADAIGRQLTFGQDQKTQKVLTIVGVTGDFPTSQMSTERPQLLLPLSQYADVQKDSVPIGSDFDEAPHLMLIARSRAGEQPAKMISAVENVARSLDPEFKRERVVTGAWLRRNSMNDFLTQSAVAGVAGSVILALAALGIYGVVGLMTATRTREIAVRVALGATRGRVLAMILLDVVKLVAPGVVFGLLLTVALVRLKGVDIGIPLSGIENVSYVTGAAIAILVAVAASLAPARRAASVQPLVAMRTQ